MNDSCAELNYLINNVCFGNETDALSLIRKYRNEVVELKNCCDLTLPAFVAKEKIDDRKHKLVGSSGLLGLGSLSTYIRKTAFIEGEFERNYYALTTLVRFATSYLDELIEHLENGTV